MDFVQLTKPRVAVLVLFTVAAGALLAGGLHVNGLVLFNVLFGTALVAAGASTLNQLIERRSDAHMRRTENRPLPAGRLQPLEVLVFGVLLGVGGVSYLALMLPHWAAAATAGRHLRSLCRRLHAVEIADDVEHAHRRRAGRLAAVDRLGGCARRVDVGGGCRCS